MIAYGTVSASAQAHGRRHAVVLATAPRQQGQDPEDRHVPCFAGQEVQALVRREPQIRQGGEQEDQPDPRDGRQPGQEWRP